ncbi:DegT/DnrJ/EryC1/StrS family aminotransferase [Psychroserpens sp. NJDZ02]|uniref:DegT/DnrJ/EryC1/StrS family aminotransferase n=1 Tax=Psychroserpens sp. NJDZ02 TaxID=2570561 RepID=UPI0010A7B024|nr:DegT/DnrJ/EryC1/StrS family aminotransferase [Psychroserpens sp. NJDZ02]QCE41158.1 DegT/DnrJ/EryC1/StrS family aminotransferase [Psychroserpens sp. NJDZ02]
MIIDFANLKLAYKDHKEEFEAAMLEVGASAGYIMGPKVKALEEKLKKFTGAKYAISCSSGTDALLLAMRALNIKPGDEIITTPFTFIATAETIAFLGATPVFVDIDESSYNIDANKIEEKITDKTKAIMPVSLYGQVADMDAINAIAKKYNLPVIEDAAQSFGATYNSKKSCNLSTIGCTSFFPAKPLGCFGDGGAVFTNDLGLANKMSSLRLHGQTKRYYHQYIGMGGRLDSIQAAILNVKLKYYNKDILERQRVAKTYTNLLGDDIIKPTISSNKTSVWAQYSIRLKNREEVQEKLTEKGIPTAIHYPLPLHLQQCFDYLGYKKGDFPFSERVANEIISLPMNPYLTTKEIEYIVENFKDSL